MNIAFLHPAHIDLSQACEAMVTRQFLWAGKHRPSEMQALSSASLLRMSQVHFYRDPCRLRIQPPLTSG